MFFIHSNFLETTIKNKIKMENKTLTSTFNLLKYTFVLVPIVAGADKFLNLLTNWEQYINPALSAALPFSAATFMMIIGLIEIAAGFIVLKSSEIGGYIVAAWLSLIAITLLIGFQFPDLAVRDLVMAIAAFSMAKLSKLTV